MQTMKATYRRAYRLARMERKDVKSAFWAVERAEHQMIHNEGHDIDRAIEAGRAALWALHWQHFAPVNIPPIGYSERHMAFSLSPEGSKQWWEKRKLP